MRQVQTSEKMVKYMKKKYGLVYKKPLQCNAITYAGRQCSRSGWCYDWDENKWYCVQHST